jgi:hypothetical protein
MLDLRTKRDDIGKTERTSQVKSNIGLQFITVTDPSQCRIAKHKRIVRSQAMRYARGRVRSSPAKSRFSIQSSASPDPDQRCPHIQPNGTTPCCCRLPDDDCGTPSFHGYFQGVVSSDLGAVDSGPRSPVNHLGSGRVDPFGCFPIVMTDYMNYLVDYCKCTHTFRVESPFGPSRPPQLHPLPKTLKQALRRTPLNMF